MTAIKKKNLDPLLQLFEHYLLNRSYEDVESFTKQLAQDYLAYLYSTPVHVPVYLRKSIQEDLEAEAHELLVKKMYGCVRLSDYQNTGKVLTLADNHFSSLDLPHSFSTEEESRSK